MYKQKYLKYKTRYLKQKMNQDIPKMNEGSNIFDLDKNYDFGTNVQDNILILKEKFGESFFIKNQDILFPVELIYKEGLIINHKYYELCYDEPERTYLQKPFSVWFNDIETGELNNNVYINLIHTN